MLIEEPFRPLIKNLFSKLAKLAGWFFVDNYYIFVYFCYEVL